MQILEQQDLEIIRGDDCEWTVTAYNAKAKEAYDLTGATAFFTLKNFGSDADASAVLKVDWTAHSDPINGKTLLILTNEQTAALAPRDYSYDIQIKTALGKIYTVAYGKFTVIGDLTIRTT